MKLFWRWNMVLLVKMLPERVMHIRYAINFYRIIVFSILLDFKRSIQRSLFSGTRYKEIDPYVTADICMYITKH